MKLPHAEFAYNKAPSYATKHSPFECVYGVNPLTPIGMLPIPTEAKVIFDAEERARETKKQHERIKAQVEKTNTIYKGKANKHRKHMEFSLGDLVWLHLRKERFPLRRKNKLMTRVIDPSRSLRG